MVGPPHIKVEAANAVLKRLHPRKSELVIGIDEAETALQDLAELPIREAPLSDYRGLYAEALYLAEALYEWALEGPARGTGRRARPTMYDGFYVVLARRLGTELWTDDRWLIRGLLTLPDFASYVRWIGDYPDGDPYLVPARGVDEPGSYGVGQ